MTASFAKYVAGLNNSIADSSSAGGNPANHSVQLPGPRDQSGRECRGAGHSGRRAPAAVRLVQRQRRHEHDADELLGAGRLGPDSEFADVAERARVRGGCQPAADEPGRRAGRLLVSATIATSIRRGSIGPPGSWSTSSATRSDLAIIENTNDLKRRYSGVTISGRYRINSRSDAGGSYTLSRLWGNFDGENSASGPLTTDLFQYPEYRQASWFAPEGDLAADQRHRASFWLNYGVPKIQGLTISVLQDWATGVPYGAGGGLASGQSGFSASAVVDARPFVTDLGYATPQGGDRETYYYTARDAFRTEASRRTDLAVELHLSRARQPIARGVRPGAGAERVQRPGSLRVRRRRVQQRRGSGAVPNRQRRAHAGEHAVARGVQPVHHDAGAGRELEVQHQLRHAVEPVCVHVAADVPA